MIIFWQAVLIDDRPDRSGQRWPKSWAPNHDYLHRTGEVGQRNVAFRDYLTSDVVYVNLNRKIGIGPSPQNMILGTRALPLVKRLYPLDPGKRTFAVAVVLRVGSSNIPYLLSTPGAYSRNPRIGVLENYGWRYSQAETVLREISLIETMFNGVKVRLKDIGSAMAKHLSGATSSDPIFRQERIHHLGNSVIMSLRREDDSVAMNALLGRAASVPGRPLLGFIDHMSSPGNRRRTRTFLSRTFAEIDVANWLAGRYDLGAATTPEWVRTRARHSVEFLSREEPYGQYRGDTARKAWWEDRPRGGLAQGRELAKAQLEHLLTPFEPPPPSVTFYHMGDNYDFQGSGPVVGVGRNARGKMVVNNSTTNVIALADELTALAGHLSSLTGTNKDDVRIISSAAESAREGNVQVVEGKLKRLSRKALEASKEIGLSVATAAISNALGL